MSKDTLGIAGVICAVFICFYLVIVLTFGNINTSTESLWCEYKNGRYSGEPTGNKFIYNPWSLGTSGECKEKK